MTMAGGELVLETNTVTKRYGSLTAVDGVSLNVKKGEIYGFLGLNGAGKTTTIRMLLGMIRPLSGTIRICGEPIKPGGMGPWDRVGYMVEAPYSYPELTVRENLQAICKLRRLHGRRYVDDILGAMRLDEYASVKAKNLSLGNNQRLGLAKAMMHKPDVLILDEPANGLDPSGIVEARELLYDLSAKRGVTVFISSHNLAEIARIATRIGIIHKGQLLREIDSQTLGSSLRRALTLDVRDRQKAREALIDKGYAPEWTEDGMLKIADPEACVNPETVNEYLVLRGLPPVYLGVEHEDLETYFLRVIGERT